MRKTILFLLIIFLSNNCYGQRKQSGKVREFNSNKKPIRGVSFDFFGANITTSDGEGSFILVFKSDKKDGDPIPPKNIEKDSYEIVYKDRLDNLLFSSSGSLPTDIIMAKKGVIQKYEDILISRASTRTKQEQQRKRDSVNGLFERGKLTLAQLQKDRNDITEFYDLQIQRAKSRAAYFSRINKDDANELEKKALFLFEQGKTKQADKLLDDYNYNKKIIEAKKKKELEQKRIKKNVNLAIIHASINVLENPNKSIKIIEKVLKASGNNLEVLIRASEFYKKHHFYQMGIQTFTKVLSHPKAKEWQKANAQSDIGSLQANIGELKKALSNYIRVNIVYKALYSIDSLELYKPNLSISYLKLGDVYSELGDLKQAETNYLNFHSITTSLSQSYPNNMTYKNRLAASYGKLGEIHNSFGDLKKTLSNYIKYNQLEKELYKTSPDNKIFKNNLAASFFNLGNTYKNLGYFKEALINYKRFYELQKELCNDYPDDIDNQNSLGASHHGLGDIYFELGDFKKALANYEEYNTIEKGLRKLYPENVDYIKNLATSYSKFGEVFASLGQWEKALVNSQEYFKVSKYLHETFPYNVSFKSGFAISCQFLGHTYEKLGYTDKALKYYKNYRELELELHSAYPNNPEYKHHLAISYSFLGSLYRSLGNPDKALEYYKPFFKLEKELSDQFPNNLDYKKKLALSYSHLGWEYRSIGDLKQSFHNYFEYNKLCQNLLNEFPNNLKFKESLALSFQGLGYTYFLFDDFDNGLLYYDKFNQLQEKLYEEQPDNTEFLYRLAGANEILALLWERENKDLNKAKYYLIRSSKLYSKLLLIYPNNDKYKKSYVNLISKLKDTEIFQGSEHILYLISSATDSSELYDLYIKLLDSYEKDGVGDNTKVEALNSIAWYGLLTSNFIDAEKNIRKGISLVPEYKYLYTNLAPALLLQGKTKQAISEYKKWANKPFNEANLPTYKEVFLADFKEFEAAGVIPENRRKDIEKIKKILSKI